MIFGAISVLFAKALLLRSVAHANWAGVLVALNLVLVPLFDGPKLVARLRDDYQHYNEHVPRFLPRLRPWGG